MHRLDEVDDADDTVDDQPIDASNIGTAWKLFGQMLSTRLRAVGACARSRNWAVSRSGSSLRIFHDASRRRSRKSDENGAGREAARSGYREYPRAMRQSTAAFLAAFVQGISGTGH
jgi:hypothetical protein